MEEYWSVYPDPRIDARTAAADALRRLSVALVAHHPGDEVLAEVTAWATAAAERAEGGEPVATNIDYQARRYIDPPPRDGARLISMSDRPISGPANPSAANMVIRREGLEAVGTVVLDRRFEASPNRSHGGITASLFDDVMGYVNTIEAVAAYTRDLFVKYLAPMPLGVPVVIRARTTERDERRSTVTAEATAPDGTIVGEAVARFAIVPREKFGL